MIQNETGKPQWKGKNGELLYLCAALVKPFPTRIKIMYYLLESTAERRARRNRDIKVLFQQLVVEEDFSCMEAYEAVGYRFYLSAEQIRQIIARRC